ncbi:MAG: efflux RND transporter periplasmic adaptor subunit [Planctomycetaceae bacterium]|nr:MAG: efflux RND transporter periplasmic adaptor subunit [Planctomycetaceae bacterium]
MNIDFRRLPTHFRGRSPSKPVLTSIVGSALLGLAILTIAGCDPAETERPEIVRPVKTMLIVPGENTSTRAFPGRVDASQRVQLAFQVSGLLVSLPVREGQEVAKGEVIAQLREDEFKARLTALQGQLDQARAALRALLAGDRPEERLRREADIRAAEQRLANARAEYRRYALLIESRAVSRADYERAETVFRIAEEDLQSARQLLEIGSIARAEDIDAQQGVVRGLEGQVVEANLNLQDCTLRAPYDGVIAERFVEEGQNVRAKEPIVKFQDVDEVEIAVDVPETVMAANLQSADVVQVVAEISGAPGVRFPVRVTEMAQRADPTTQTFNVRVAMSAPEGINVLPGMSATVTMTYRRAEILGSRMMVPMSAVYHLSSGQQIVWVLGPEDTVTGQEVTLGSSAAGDVEIASGVEPGQRIVVAGVNRLREGMRVRDLGDELGGSQR